MDTGIKHKKQKSFLIAGLIITGIIFTALFCGCIEPEEENEKVTKKPLQNTTRDIKIKTTSSISEPADLTLNVVKFEPTRPCQSCTNIGNFAKETIELHFLEDYETGKISYETVNYRDPENMDIVKKYGIVLMKYPYCLFSHSYSDFPHSHTSWVFCYIVISQR